MKILIIIVCWVGGVGRVVSNQKRIMEKLGHKVEVISREDDLGIAFNSGRFISGFFKLRKEVKKRNYDILYVQDWSCALPLMLFKNHYVCFNGNEPKNAIFQNCIGHLKGKKLIVIGDKLKERFPKSTLAYVGVNLHNFKNLNMEREKGTVGFANLSNYYYNYEQIKLAVENLGMKFIETNMKLTKKGLIEFYNTIETFISLPREFAGFNLSWIEAMACGVPKIIGNYNGVGKGLDINHIEDFESIEDAIINAKIKKDYKISQEFDWDVQTKKILEVFKRKLK